MCRARWLDSLWTRVFYRMMYFSLCVPFQRHFLQGHFSQNFTKFIVSEKLRSRDRRQNNLLHRSLKCNYCEFLKLNWITLIYSWILGVACIPPTPISEIILLIQNNLMLFCSSPIYWIYLENILFHKHQSYIYL